MKYEKDKSPMGLERHEGEYSKWRQNFQLFSSKLTL